MFASDSFPSQRASSLPKNGYPKTAFGNFDPARTVDADRLGQQVGPGHRLVSAGADPSTPLMQGSFSITHLRDGLSLHCTDVVHLHDMETQFVMQEQSIKVLLKLEGNAQVAMGKQSLQLDAGDGRNAAPLGTVVSLNTPDTFQRISRAGTRQRMIVLSLKPIWFDAAHMSQDLFREHLSVHNWIPTRHAIAIAKQLIHPLGMDGPMQRLHQESRALELIAEALSQLMPTNAAGGAGLPASAQQRIERLRKLLDSGEADHLDMRAIAQHIGCNANTLQQQFREVCSQTIFDYLRQRRLERAAHALQHDGVSVGQAAEIAGYSSQANFSTAFRRKFGLQPKHCRNKL